MERIFRRNGFHTVRAEFDDPFIRAVEPSGEAFSVQLAITANALTQTESGFI